MKNVERKSISLYAGLSDTCVPKPHIYSGNKQLKRKFLARSGVILLGRWRQGDHQFKASLGCQGRFSFIKPKPGGTVPLTKVPRRHRQMPLHSLDPVWSSWRVLGQPELHIGGEETLNKCVLFAYTQPCLLPRSPVPSLVTLRNSK